MPDVKTYLIAICSAAILCAVLKQIAGKDKAGGQTVHLLCGLFIAICIIAPWKNFTLEDIQIRELLSLEQAEIYTNSGKEMMHNDMLAIITAETEAYILEKANQMNMLLEVRVELSGEGVPDRAVITGKYTQGQKEELSAFLLQELGIEKEMQSWR